MMYRKILFFFILIFFINIIVSSQNETVITIDNRNISLFEFERLYNKNKSLISDEPQNVEEFLERFINFKLKVLEAESLGNDTTQTFLNELATYRRELTKPYMVDSIIGEQIIEEAYHRILKDTEASHILINLDSKASPEDTLAAWNKIMQLRSEILKGEDFGKVAEQRSEDISAKRNKGYLGWFTAFQMVQDFEIAAFSTPPGGISMPVRTRFGYHIIKGHSQRPARGSVKVAHIFISVPENTPEDESADAKERIYALHESLTAGVDFSTVAGSYSEDRGTANDGGELPWFTIGRMIPEFEDAAFSLQFPGEISKPVKSFYGWHIIKLIEKKQVGSYEEERDNIAERINAENYSKLTDERVISELKDIHNFQLRKENLEIFYAIIDTSIFNASWSMDINAIPNDVLFTLGSLQVTQREFARHLEKKQTKITPYNIKTFINEEFRKFADEIVYNYEESLLELKYPEIKFILQEYHDGILLFELTDKMVWSKAVEDTLGLEEFFDEHLDNYKWGARAEAYIISIKDPVLLRNARKLTAKNADNKDFSKEMMAQHSAIAEGVQIDVKGEGQSGIVRPATGEEIGGRKDLKGGDGVGDKQVKGHRRDEGQHDAAKALESPCAIQRGRLQQVHRRALQRR